MHFFNNCNRFFENNTQYTLIIFRHPPLSAIPYSPLPDFMHILIYIKAYQVKFVFPNVP